MVNCTWKYSLKYEKYMPKHAFLPYLLSVCATITIKVATNLTDKFFMHSAVTLTWKFQGQIITCICLKNAWPDFARNKSNVNKLVGLFHIWRWPLTLPLTVAKNFQGQILKLPYLQNVWPDRKKSKRVNSLDEWFYVLLIISDLRFAFIVCCNAV